MKKLPKTLSIIVTSICFLLGCSDREPQDITPELLLKLGYVEDNKFPGIYSLENVRFGDAVHDLGIENMNYQLPLAQPISSTIQMVRVQNWYIYIYDSNKKLIDDHAERKRYLRDPDRICRIEIVRAKEG